MRPLDLLLDAIAKYAAVTVPYAENSAEVVYTVKQVRCFLRDDTDRLLMEAISENEKKELKQNIDEKINFLHKIVVGMFLYLYLYA